MTLGEDELKATDQDKKAGITNVMKKLADTFGDDSVSRRGESLEEFFGKVSDSKYRRNTGERIVDWITRWE